jgi:hypothetical protein
VNDSAIKPHTSHAARAIPEGGRLADFDIRVYLGPNHITKTGEWHFDAVDQLIYVKKIGLKLDALLAALVEQAVRARRRSIWGRVHAP